MAPWTSNAVFHYDRDSMSPCRRNSGSVRDIQALESCKYGKHQQSTNVFQRLCEARSVDNLACGFLKQRLLSHTSFFSDHLVVHFPVGLAFGATASGRPDLRIELVRLRWGNTDDSRPCRHRSQRGILVSEPWVSTPSSWSRPRSEQLEDPCVSRQSVIPDHTTVICIERRRHRGAVIRLIGQYASTAGALMLFSLLHRDAAAAIRPSFVLPGLAVVTAELAAAVIGGVTVPENPLSLGDSDSDRNMSSYMHSPMGLASAGTEQLLPQQPSRRLRGRLRGLAAGLAQISRSAAASLERILGASALLSLASGAWRAVHASSAALADAVADLTTVGLSYSFLARQVQLGLLPPGRDQEMAWRRLHKAAAQRLACHLSDLPEQPPLGPALAVLQRCSIAAGLAVDGVPLCGTLDALMVHSGSGGSYPDGGLANSVAPGSSRCQLLLSFSYSRRRGRRHRQRTTIVGAATTDAAELDGIAQRCSSAASAAVGDCNSSRGTTTAAAETGRLPENHCGPNEAVSGDAMSHARTIPSHHPMSQTLQRPNTHQSHTEYSEITAAMERDQGISRPKPLAALAPPSWALPEALALVSSDAGGESSTLSTVAIPSEQLGQARYQERLPQTDPGRRTERALPPTPNNHAQVSGDMGPSEMAASSPGRDVSPISLSTAARRGLPRAASASSLRAIIGQPATPTSVISRMAAVTLAPLSGSRYEDETSAMRVNATTAAAAATAASIGSCSPRTASPPPPQFPSHRELPAVDVAAADAECPQSCNSDFSWGSGRGCTMQHSAVAAPNLTSSAANGGSTGGACGAIARTTTQVTALSLVGSKQGSSADGCEVDHRFRRTVSANRLDCEIDASGSEALVAVSPSSFILSGANPSLQEHQDQLGQTQAGCSLQPATEGCSIISVTGGGRGGADGCAWELPVLSRAQEVQLMRREQEEVEALGLPLYGRIDHIGMLNLLQHRSVDARERLALACRAAYLILVFAPFLTVGLALLLISAILYEPSGSSNNDVSSTSSSRIGSGSGRGGRGARRPSGAVDDATALNVHWRKSLGRSCRRGAWWLLLYGCRQSGAAFIKWGQWAATRVDLFPDDFCEALSQLHDQAPKHSFAFTRRQVERAFGVSLDAMFEAFDPRPVASGSIAQVHRALMRCSDGRPLEVAVKVVHPRVELRIQQDFALLQPAAAVLGRLPSLRSLSLAETLNQFSCTMTAQADLRVEAAHLRRFHANFSRVASQVTTPRPLPGLVRCEVMVESWEAGRSVAAFIRQPGPLNTAIVGLGVDAYLKMLLQDNFVHTDLHPGNIMVRLGGPDGSPLPAEQQGPIQNPSPVESERASSIAAAAAPASPKSNGSASPPIDSVRVQLVLLDFGLAEELTPAVRHHFISFLHHLLRGNGASAAMHLLRWTSRPQSCPNPAAFVADMETLAATCCNVHSTAGIDLDDVMKSVLRLSRKHAVTIDSCYASLVIAVCVIVGFATSLDPEVNLVDAAIPAMLAHALTGRVVGRLYS